MACTTASVSYREELARDELLFALGSGDVPPRRAAHLRALIEEAPESLLHGLVEQAGRIFDRPRVEKNLLRVAEALEVPERVRALLGR